LERCEGPVRDIWYVERDGFTSVGRGEVWNCNVYGEENTSRTPYSKGLRGVPKEPLSPMARRKGLTLGPERGGTKKRLLYLAPSWRAVKIKINKNPS